MYSKDIQFKDLLDQATDLVHVVTPEGIILYANETWQRTLQYSSGEVIGKSIYSFLREEERDKFIALRKDLVIHQYIHQPVEASLVSKGGKTIFVEGFMSCRIDDGKVIYTHSIFRDVTERKQQEKRKQEEFALTAEREQNFHQLIENAPDAIIVIDRESRIRLWNPKSEKIFGWTFQEVEGTLLGSSIIPEQYRQMHYEGMKRLLSTGVEHVLNKTIDITALNKQGDEFYISLTISRSNLKGDPAFIAFIRDISEQKKMAEEIDIQKQQLEKTNEELAQYASLASHDLKEPIRKILIFSDLLIKNYPMDNILKERQLIDKIYTSAKRMESLIESIGKYSTISLTDIDEPPVIVNEVINEVLEDLEEVIRSKNAIVQMPELHAIPVNRIHLYQLFQNLFTNAIKYSKEKIQPVISISSEETADNFILFRFSDNGIGFPVEYAEKVFLPFQRLHGNKYSGIGIGLSICKKIIEVYGGTISVESIPDDGSTFIFTLPAKK